MVDSDVEEILPQHLMESRGIPSNLLAGASGSGQPQMTHPLLDAGGVEDYTMIRFRTGDRWLGGRVQGEGPLEALNAFSLTPDKARLGQAEDEAVLADAKVALGKVSFFCFAFCNSSSLLFVAVNNYYVHSFIAS